MTARRRMNTEETDSGERLDKGRRKLILGALSLPLAGFVARASAGEAEDLAERVEGIAGPLVGRLGFSAQRLDGGPVIALHADEHFPMASLFKIPIVLAALRRVQAGDIALDAMLVVPPEKYVMSEVISVTFIHPGVSLSLANLIEVMIMMLNQDITEQAIRGARRAHDCLMAGFTTVRDIGGNAFGLRKALDAGMFPGPRIYPSGPAIGQTTGHGDFRTDNDGHPYFDGRERAGVAERLGWTKIDDGPDEVRRAVRDNLFRGAAQIKLMAGGGVTSFTDPLFSAAYSAAELAAGVEEAKRYGTYPHGPWA